MKVKELIQKLSAIDQNLEVYCYEEVPGAVAGGNPGPFELADVAVAQVDRTRIDGKAMFTFGSADETSKVVILSITGDI